MRQELLQSRAASRYYKKELVILYKAGRLLKQRGQALNFRTALLQNQAFQILQNAGS